MAKQRFSDREGFAPPDAEITIRHDAPYDLRGLVLQFAYGLGMGPAGVRPIVCRVLHKRPDTANWSEYPNIRDEVERLIDTCEWFEVYDIIEAIYEALHGDSRREAESFAAEINKYFRRAGIGWQMVGGEVRIRGPEAFEQSVRTAKDALDDSGRTTASDEIHEALKDLSRRPDPDITGAVQHAMAALECVARDVCGDPRSTLGELLKKNPDLFPPPLDQSVEKAWGYASERGRHLREGREPDPNEAELVVGLASTLATYLSRKVARAESPR